MENEKKVALVTGASRGIGRAIALALSGKGYDLVINYAGAPTEAEEVKAAIEAAGGRAMIVHCDVSKAEDVAAMFDEIKKEFGRLDVLVNNAGITRDSLLVRLKEENWDAVIDTDMKSVFLTIKAAAPMMMKQKQGAIVNIASVVGITGNAGQINYSAAKAGVIGMTKTAAKELASRGVRVNAVAPGFIATAMTAVLPEKVKEDMIHSIPLGRMGQAEDVAHAVCFLVSDEAAYITGQVLTVDGGMVM